MRLTMLALLCLLLTPSASAAFWDRAVEIEIPAHRVGMTARWDIATEGEDGSDAFLLQTVSLGRAQDGYGIERDVVTYQVQSEDDGEPSWGALCDILQGGTESVQRRTILGGWSNSWDREWSSEIGPVELSGEQLRSETKYTRSYGGSCDVPITPAGTYAEGQELWFDELWAGAAHTSAVAYADEFEGRDALSARFDIWGGNATVTLADGLAPVARLRFEGPDGTYDARLTGLRAGEGPLVPANVGARLPPRHPSAAFATASRMAEDLADLPVAYPLGEAIANLRNDPQMGLDAWLDAHPDAQLVGAYYDRQGRNTLTDGDQFETDGGWGITFGEGTTWRYWYSSRSAIGYGVGALLPSATRDVKNFEFEEDVLDPEATYHYDIEPYEAADVATLLDAAAAEGLAEADIQVVEFFRFQSENGPTAYLRLSDVSYSGDSAEGISVQLDMRKGGMDAIGDTSLEVQRTGVLALEPGDIGSGGIRAASAPLLASPAGGIGLAAAAVTGIGLLALVLKLLFPLYSRLRQDRILDNEVRARLYERIRREPGIHRAELVDFSGIGEGATRHHLAQLVKHRLLVETHVDGFVRYFAAGEVPPEIARREAVLRAGSHREVYELLLAEPGLSLREAAERLGMSAPSVHRAKKKLAQAGLLPHAAAKAEA